MKTKKNLFFQFSAAPFAAVTLASLANQSAQAATGSWQLAGDGNWGVNANWTGATFPNGEGQAANFSVNTPDLLITTTLDGNYTVATSAINSGQSADWLVTSPTNTLTFDHTGTTNSSIANNFNGSSLYTLDTNILLNSNLVLSGNGNNGAKVTLGATAGGRTITGTGNITINNTSTFGAGIMTINSNINTSGGVFNTSSQGQNHLIAGVIGTTVTGVTQNGSKTMILSGNNTYTTPTTVSLGTLQAGVASVAGVSGAFGNNSAVTIADAAASLSLSNFNTQIGSLAGGGAVGGTVSLGNAILTTGGLDSNTAFAGIISGTGGLTKIGSGTQTLSGANTFTGPITFSGGGIIISSSGAARTFSSTTQPFNVTAASSLDWNNTSATSAIFTIDGAAAFSLGNTLTIRNTSTTIANANQINLARPMTGAGNLEVETYNNIAVSSDNFTLGRVQLAASSPSWTGNLVITRGTVSLSGTTASTTGSGAGDIVIGAVGNALGAGLTFNTSSTLTYLNDIIVNPGGFRAIRGNGFSNVRITFSGAVTLDGDLTLDHSWGTSDNRITLDGVVSGSGGLTVTRAVGGGHAETTVVLTKANTYTGPTVIKPTASLSVTSTSSLTSNIKVESTGRLGGAGGTSGTLTLDDGANFFFFYSPTYLPFDVDGTVTVANSFGVASIRGGSRGEPVPWNTVPADTYTLIGTTPSTFNTGGLTNNITNFGVANAATGLVGGRTAYFKNGGGSGGGGLQLVVNSGYAAWQVANGNTSGGLDDDHDSDGVDNGTEFFLAGSTNSTGFTPLPGVVDTSGVLRVTWVNGATYTGAYTTDFVVETSDTLDTGSWAPAPSGVGAGNVEISGTNVKYTFPTTGPKKFARLKVTGP